MDLNFKFTIEQAKKYEKKLKPYALKSSKAKGKFDNVDESIFDGDEKVRKLMRYKVDSSRIVFSRTFRRLRGKTQVFWREEHDLPRCRLSHTLEVSEMSKFVARVLGVNEDAVEAIALGHDLGHPPFGHSGERALRQILKEIIKKNKNIGIIGGFEHNWQSIRAAEIYYTPIFALVLTVISI